jgi:hypothetical protein
LNEIGMGCDGEEAWQVSGVVGHVRVHRDDPGDIVMFEAPRETISDCRTNSSFGTTIQNEQREALTMELFSEVSSTVCAPIVHNQNPEILSLHHVLN